ncbi:RNA polymerase sigma factor [Formosa algae]|uniref:RNA polymerase sigma-70 factor (ECF subfamily) n=1 Tax=Formosa algae TaxID=225843 RepID=A0A9X0YHE6_9FLAO|nr:sigma-70 family RNA polymerase sigma factor [Formosa algae]MBP1838875.1 RNA polymerase sigma-70 factor (ECF subfamily) [Formosa algae]MDQ0333652.1 RNA polymerase sigma-70 factor (ECF subfamily) [Formosa algae]OEI78841.1 RNA polymerase subunit sigma [Formosa algae]
MQDKELIPQLFKTEYRKIISVLCKLFGIEQIEIAEDIANDTFLLASETWGLKGIPENPKAWLYTVAKNKTKDYFRRKKRFTENIAPELKNKQSCTQEIELDLSEANIKDSELQMLFAVCNPINSNESQIALALKILCGFGIDEIANALLSTKENINKRLYRAKHNLRVHNVDLSFPSNSNLKKRLDNVLSILYLLFNEGYYSSTSKHTISKDICFEAMRLLYILTENNKTNIPKVNALMALFCFHTSRFEARFDQVGLQVIYKEQNKNKWNLELIAKGETYLNISAKGQEVSKYHLEAGIAFWHTRLNVVEKKKWNNILQLYNRLLQIEYSPITALNRTYALAMAQHKEIALKEALKIDLKQNHLYHVLLAELYCGIDKQNQIAHLDLAIHLTKNENDRKFLIHKKDKVSN